MERLGVARVVGPLAASWCVAFVVLGLWARLHWFADGSLFAYAVAADDGWAMHWRQIPGRVAAWLWASWPGQVVGRVTGDPALGVAAYGALLFAAPGLGLALAWWADRTRVLRCWAAASTVLLCPVVFGFPTEIWVAHAAVWPALVLLWAPQSVARRLGGMVLLAVVVLSHEAAVVWALLLVAALRLSPGGWGTVRLGAVALVPALAAWAALKAAYPPDPYVAEVLRRNAWNLLSLGGRVAPLLVELGAALALYGAVLWAARRAWVAALVAAGALLAWWGIGAVPLHAWDRYFLRLLLVAGVPGLGLLAVLQAAGRWPRGWRVHQGVVAGALAVVALVHAGQTARFVAAWRGYVAAVAGLSDAAAPDVALVDPNFVSAERMAGFGPLSWHSTTPFLSVLAAGSLRPARLVVDPEAGYFWFDCATAMRNEEGAHALAAESRTLVRRYACLHR